MKALNSSIPFAFILGIKHHNVLCGTDLVY